MNKRLTSGLTEAQKKEFTEMIKYNEVLKRVREILQEDADASRRERRSLKSLIQLNYSEHQADRNATERTYLKVLELITA